MTRYASAEAFKTALENRLRRSAKKGDFTRKRQLLVFERFLARVVAVFGDAVTLKGGVSLKLRLEQARVTKDVDLRMTGSPGKVLARLREAGGLDLSDFMTFDVQPHSDPTIQNDGLKYDGLRFRVECKLNKKLYGEPFGVDIVFDGPILGEPDVVQAEDILAFAGVAPPTLRIYPIETHIAEKLHAYTMPRKRPNSRVKDLPDLALLGTAQPLDAKRFRAALAQTFTFRGTHAAPEAIPAPIDAWKAPYAAMARKNELPWSTLDEVTHVVRAFLDPVLSGAVIDATWNPATWTWSPEHVPSEESPLCMKCGKPIRGTPVTFNTSGKPPDHAPDRRPA